METFFYIFSSVVILIYGIQNGVFIWGIRKSGIRNREQERPSVSIIVSLKNEEHNVSKLVKSLLSVCYAADLEILLVDDHSEDQTWNELQNWKSDSVHVLKNQGSGKKRAIESALKIARNEWVAITDADCEMNSDWMTSMTAAIDSTSRMVLGPVAILQPHGFLQNFQSIEFLGLQGATCGSAQMGFPISANAANMLVHRHTFLEINPYADNYHLRTGDDLFLLLKMSNQFPGSIRYCADQSAVIFTHPVTNWRTYFSQRIRWASKGSAYRQFAPLFSGLTVFLTSTFLIALPLSALFQPIPDFLWLILGTKVVSDYFLMDAMKNKIGGSIPFFDFLLSTILYPAVVVYSVTAGLFRR